MNKFWTNLKSWYGVVVLILIAGGVVWTTLGGLPFVNSLRSKWQAYRLQVQWEKPYREDTYGGKTPEETYDMFLNALRKGDTTLASKYFVVDDQARWKKTMEEYEKQNLLVNFVVELENTRKIWKKLPQSNETIFKDTISYEYTTVVNKDTTADFNGQKINVPAGNYANSTTFGLNTYTKLWKINSL